MSLEQLMAFTVTNDHARQEQVWEAVARSYNKEPDRDAFASAWQAEVAAVPEFSISTFHVVTGLLLPIWRRLPDEGCRVYRLQTDDGERVIGRLVSPAWVAQAVETEAPTLSSTDAWTTLLDGRTVLELADGLQLCRAKVMGEFRVELTGFADGMVDRLKAMGLLSEIISWRMRLFVPVRVDAPAILAALLDRYPLARIADRSAV
jgi:hypothetical protein